MTLDFSLLNHEFSLKAQQLIQKMEEKGYKVNPYYGIRTLEEQAKLYRRSRSTQTILLEIKRLEEINCHYLASILERVGPQPAGPWATNALPGESYHEFGLAMDVLLTPGEESDYKVYADTAVELGLTAGYYFTHCDMGHVQLGNTTRPYNFTTREINDHFQLLENACDHLKSCMILA